MNAILEATRQIAADIAGPNADEVDRHARFPIESISALKSAGVLSAGIPSDLGGAGMNIVELGNLCRILATRCASTAMILGMHFIKVSSIVHFGKGNARFEDYLRSVVAEQRLVASVTSEEGIGGNIRTSASAAEIDGGRFKLTKHSTCLSYGAEADDLLITCRKSPDAAASSQVLVLAMRGDFTLERLGVWDSMGMRGTCSPPFAVSVEANTWQIFERSFAEIATRTMVPDTHYIWSNVWLGIASDAASRARVVVQGRARKNPTILPESAKDLAELEIRLERLKDTVKSVGDRYLEAHLGNDEQLLSSIEFSLKVNALKLNASQLVADICLRAMSICGFSGYLNNSASSVTRQLRDALSAALMISNHRIIESNATNLMIYRATDL